MAIAVFVAIISWPRIGITGPIALTAATIVAGIYSLVGAAARIEKQLRLHTPPTFVLRSHAVTIPDTTISTAAAEAAMGVGRR